MTSLFEFTSLTPSTSPNYETYEVVATPNKKLALTNKVYFCSLQGIPKYIKLNSINKSFVFATENDSNVKIGAMALNGRQREDSGKKIKDQISFTPYMREIEPINLICFQVDSTGKLEINYDELTTKLKQLLQTQPLSITQTHTCVYKSMPVTITVESIKFENDEVGQIGMFNENTTIVYLSSKPYINLSNQSSDGIFKNGVSLSNLNIRELGIKHTKGILLHGPPGCGKCLGINTPVLLFDGTIKMVQDIVIGDKLMGDDSTEREVLSLARGKEQMYKIKQEDGDDYVVNESHILSMRMTKPKKLKKTKTSYKISYFSQKEFVYRKKTFNFADYGGSKEQAFRCATEMLNAAENTDVVDIGLQKYLKIQRDPRRALKGYKVSVSFQKQELKYDPYITGLLLAQSNVVSDGTNLSEVDLSILNFIRNDIQISNERLMTSNTEFAEVLNLTYVPQINKINSKNSRIRLLAGIIDLKGDLHKKTYRFSTKNEQFANDIIFICRSLGFVCTSNKVILPDHQYIRIKFTGPLVAKIPCMLQKNITNQASKENLNTVITIEKLGVDDYYGFEISGNRRFLLGDFTVTHNTLLAREIENY